MRLGEARKIIELGDRAVGLSPFHRPRHDKRRGRDVGRVIGKSAGMHGDGRNARFPLGLRRVLSKLICMTDQSVIFTEADGHGREPEENGKP